MARPGSTARHLGGGVTIVNFFASWCVPCRLEHPLLDGSGQASSTCRSTASPTRTRPTTRRNYLQQLGDPYKSVGLDESGRVGIDFGVYGVPETYVVDKAGRIRLRHVGPLTAEDVAKELAPLVQELGRS